MYSNIGQIWMRLKISYNLQDLSINILIVLIIRMQWKSFIVWLLKFILWNSLKEDQVNYISEGIRFCGRWWWHAKTDINLLLLKGFLLLIARIMGWLDRPTQQQTRRWSPRGKTIWRLSCGLAIIAFLSHRIVVVCGCRRRRRHCPSSELLATFCT